jgi:hypothetical protein
MRNPISIQQLQEVPRGNIYKEGKTYEHLFYTQDVSIIYNTPSNHSLSTITLTTPLTVGSQVLPAGNYVPIVGLKYVLDNGTEVDLPKYLCYVSITNGKVYEILELDVALSNTNIFLTCAPDSPTTTLLMIIGGFDAENDNITDYFKIVDVSNPTVDLQENSNTSVGTYLAGNLAFYNSADSNVILHGGIFTTDGTLISTRHYSSYEDDLADHWTNHTHEISISSGTYGGKNYDVTLTDVTSTSGVPNDAAVTGSAYTFPRGTYGGHSTAGVDGYNYLVPAAKAVNESGSIVAYESLGIYSVIYSTTQNIHEWDMPSCTFPAGVLRTLPVSRSDEVTAEVGFIQSNGLYYYFSSASDTVSYSNLVHTNTDAAVFSALTNGAAFGVTTTTSVLSYNILTNLDNARVLLLNSSEVVAIGSIANHQVPDKPVLPEKAGILVPDMVDYSVTSPNTGEVFTKTYLKPARVYAQLAERVIPERPAERMRIEVRNLGRVWDSLTTDALGDLVEYDNKVYISGRHGNIGNTPDSSPRYEWLDIDDPVYGIPNTDFFKPMLKWDDTTTYNIGDEVIVPELGMRYKATEDNLLNVFPPDEENTKWAPFGPVNELIPFDESPVTIFELPKEWGGVSFIFEQPQTVIKGVAGIGINSGILHISTFIGTALREGTKSILEESKDNFIHLLAPEYSTPFRGCTSTTDAFTPREVEVVLSRPSSITEDPIKVTNILLGKYYPFSYSEFSASSSRKVKTSQKDIDGVATISVPDSWYDLISSTVRFNNLPDYQRAVRDLNRASGRYSLLYGGNNDYEFSHILAYGLVDYSTTASDPVTNTIKVSCQGVASAYTGS